jgi:Glycosyl hydrolase family 47
LNTLQTHSIKAESDSFYEYLYKAYLTFGDNDFYIMHMMTYDAIEKWTRHGGVHLRVNTKNLHASEYTYESLESFWAGIQVQVGDIDPAVQHLRIAGHTLTRWILPPEKVNLNDMSLNLAYNLLRPEVCEGIFFLSRALPTDKNLLQFSLEFSKRFEKYAKVGCGYSSLNDVSNSGDFKDHQESFFIAETLKYLYMTFDPTNFVATGPYIFTTEAHPVPILVKSSRWPKKSYKYTLKDETQLDYTGISQEQLLRLQNPSLRVCDAKKATMTRLMLSLQQPATSSSGSNYWMPKEMPM